MIITFTFFTIAFNFQICRKLDSFKEPLSTVKEFIYYLFDDN